MFNLAEWFCKDIGPINVGVYLSEFDVTIFDVVFEAMPF
jgi:hypothetical protein